MSNGMIPEGKYAAKPISAKLAETTGGTEYVDLQLEITEPGEYQGRKIGAEKWLTDKAWEYSVRDLKTCGWKGTDIRAIEVTEPVSITIQHEQETDRDGKVKTGPDGKPRMRARVRWINPLRAKPVESSKAQSLAERFKARIEALNARDEELPY